MDFFFVSGYCSTRIVLRGFLQLFKFLSEKKDHSPNNSEHEKEDTFQCL